MMARLVIETSILSPRVKDLRGRRFGHLVVVEFVGFHQSTIQRHALWLCRCDCGRYKRLFQPAIYRRPNVSCGCRGRQRGEIPGLWKDHPNEFRVWSGMIQRCTNRRCHEFPYYGGRGITVHPRWLRFHLFFEDVGPRPSLDYTLERLDNNGPYTPGNVCWALRSVQARNTRRTINLTYQNKTQCIAQWARELNIEFNTIKYRYRKRWPIEDILYQGHFSWKHNRLEHPSPSA